MRLNAVCKRFRMCVLQNIRMLTLNHDASLPTLTFCTALVHLRIGEGCTRWPLRAIPTSPPISDLVSSTDTKPQTNEAWVSFVDKCALR